ncbi:MAG TPA: hypothetical protein ENG20_04295 [Methanomicrobia archaeon]|nr:hypothetical protein [Methanomicrobia archaeon]
MKNSVDIFVVFLISICIISFVYPYLSKHTFEKDVYTDVETAVKCIRNLEENGFFYTLTIKGWWNSDNSKFIEEVFLTDYNGDEMEVIRKNGDIATVGDLTDLKTEIRTSYIKVNIKNKEVYSFEINFDTNFDGLEKMINDHPVQKVINTAISGKIIMKNFNELNPIEERKLNDELRKKFFYCKKIQIDEKSLYLEFFSTKYLKDLKEFYNGEIEGKIKVYVRY